MTDQGDALIPRYEGRFDETGQTSDRSRAGATQVVLAVGVAQPDTRSTDRVNRVRAARSALHRRRLTLGHVNEHPFSRAARRPVRIDLKDSEQATKSFDLDVTINRGERTYTHPLPEQSTDEFLSDAYKGFGEPQNPKSSPAYVELSGVPSATVDVSQER